MKPTTYSLMQWLEEQQVVQRRVLRYFHHHVLLGEADAPTAPSTSTIPRLRRFDLRPSNAGC